MAAPTSAGKTTLLLWQVLDWLRTQPTAPILYWSCEMDAPHLMARMVGMMAGTSMWNVIYQERQGMIGPAVQSAWQQLTQQAHRLIMIDEPTTAEDLVALAHRMHENSAGIGAVVADYLQELPPVGLYHPDARRFIGNRELEVGMTAVMLRELARELQIPVLAAAQLNRQTNKQNDYIPDLLGLRESGRIEQSAALVLGIRNEIMSGAPEASQTTKSWAKTQDIEYSAFGTAEDLRQTREGAQMAVREQMGPDAILTELFVLKNRLRGGVGAVVPVGMNPETGAYQRLAWRYEPPQGTKVNRNRGSKGKITGKRTGRVIGGGWGAVAESAEEGIPVDINFGKDEDEDDFYAPR